jgi:hypothetical protein
MACKPSDVQKPFSGLRFLAGLGVRTSISRTKDPDKRREEMRARSILHVVLLSGGVLTSRWSRVKETISREYAGECGDEPEQACDFWLENSCETPMTGLKTPNLRGLFDG